MITTKGTGEILFSGDNRNITSFQPFKSGSKIGFLENRFFGIELIRIKGKKPSIFASLSMSSLEDYEQHPTKVGYCTYTFGILVWDDWGNITRFYFDNIEDQIALLAECKRYLPRKEK